jgi:rubrerythrin
MTGLKINKDEARATEVIDILMRCKDYFSTTPAVSEALEQAVVEVGKIIPMTLDEMDGKYFCPTCGHQLVVVADPDGIPTGHNDCPICGQQIKVVLDEEEKKN